MEIKNSIEKENNLISSCKSITTQKVFQVTKQRNILSEISNRSFDEKNSSDALDQLSNELGLEVLRPPSTYNLADDPEILNINNQYPIEIRLYVNDIYNVHKQNEKLFLIQESYVEKHSFVTVKMRSVLIDWLVDVHYKFRLLDETLFLTVSYIDRYLQKNFNIDKKLFQLIGLTCLFIASKYEELYFPEIKDLILYTDNSYKKEDVKRMEGRILNSLGFQLTQPTVNTFLERYLKAAEGDETLENVAFYFAERTLQEYKLIFYYPSLIASASVYLSKKYSGHLNCWSNILEKISGYTELEVAEVSKTIENLITGPKPIHQAVFRKYTRTTKCKASYIVHDKIGDTDEYVLFSLLKKQTNL